jgi:hypothetical protein
VSQVPFVSTAFVSILSFRVGVTLVTDCGSGTRRAGDLSGADLCVDPMSERCECLIDGRFDAVVPAEVGHALAANLPAVPDVALTPDEQDAVVRGARISLRRPAGLSKDDESEMS